MINMANSEKNLNCFLSKDECSEIRNFLKIFNIFLFSTIILLTLNIASLLNIDFKNFVFLGFFISFANYFGHIDRFLSELLATSLLLLNIYILLKTINSKKISYFFILSVVYALLVYTKGYLIYWCFFSIFFIFIYKYIKKLDLNFNILKLIFTIFLIFLILSPWQLRNYNYFEKYEISGGGRAEVNLAVRAYFNTIKIDEYILGYVFYIPGLGKKLLNYFNLDDRVKRLDNSEISSFYLDGLPNILRRVDLEKFSNTDINITNFYGKLNLNKYSNEITYESINLTLKNFHKHILNIPLLIYRGLYINHSDSIIYKSEKKYFKYLSYIYLIFFNAPIFVFFVLLIRKQINLNKNTYIITLPIIFYLILFSNVSNFLPRFSMMLYPFYYLIFFKYYQGLFKK